MITLLGKERPNYRKYLSAFPNPEKLFTNCLDGQGLGRRDRIRFVLPDKI